MACFLPLARSLPFPRSPFPFRIKQANLQIQLTETALLLQTKALVGDDDPVLGVKLSVANYSLGSGGINSEWGSSLTSLHFVRTF